MKMMNLKSLALGLLACMCASSGALFAETEKNPAETVDEAVQESAQATQDAANEQIQDLHAKLKEKASKIAEAAKS